MVAKLPAIFAALRALVRGARERPADAAVLIDFPDFHALLARRLVRLGVPIVYYVSPQVWAWRRGRARTIAGRALRIVTLFPFEAEIYRALGADAVCAGHPLVDDVREGLARPSPLPAKTRRRLVLLPGSRRGEISRHWGPMAEAAWRLAARFDLEVVAVRAPGLPASLFSGGEDGASGSSRKACTRCSRAPISPSSPPERRRSRRRSAGPRWWCSTGPPRRAPPSGAS